MSENKFKGVNNHWRTRSLFWETNRYEEKYPSLYTLKDEESRGYPSLRLLFLQEMDPTEYGFAEKHLGGWDHWLHLCAVDWFQPHVDRWRAELAKRIQHQLATEAKAIIADPASTSSAKLRAMSFLSQAEYEPKDKPKRGRPSAAEVEGELKAAARTASNVEEDFERLGLTGGTKPN